MVVLQLLAGPSVKVRNHGKYTERRHVMCVACVLDLVYRFYITLFHVYTFNMILYVYIHLPVTVTVNCTFLLV